MQETLTSALNSRLRDPGAARGWLFAVCSRKAIDLLRRRQRLERAQAQLPQGPAPRLPEDLALDRERDARLRTALGCLDEPYREALELRYLQGLPYRELAERLGTIERTARTWVGRGLVKLRAKLGGRR